LVQTKLPGTDIILEVRERQHVIGEPCD